MCLYICIIYMYNMYIYIYTYITVCIDICMHKYYTYVCICMHTYIHLYTRVHTCKHTVIHTHSTRMGQGSQGEQDTGLLELDLFLHVELLRFEVAADAVLKALHHAHAAPVSPGCARAIAKPARPAAPGVHGRGTRARAHACAWRALRHGGYLRGARQLYALDQGLREAGVGHAVLAGACSTTMSMRRVRAQSGTGAAGRRAARPPRAGGAGYRACRPPSPPWRRRRGASPGARRGRAAAWPAWA